MNTPTAVPASSNEFDRAISALVAAFIADPFIRWLFPDAKQYLTYFPQVLKYFAGAAFEHGGAYRSDDFSRPPRCGFRPTWNRTRRPLPK